jgi:hypothetical protein
MKTSNIVTVIVAIFCLCSCQNGRSRQECGPRPGISTSTQPSGPKFWKRYNGTVTRHFADGHTEIIKVGEPGPVEFIPREEAPQSLQLQAAEAWLQQLKSGGAACKK